MNKLFKGKRYDFRILNFPLGKKQSLFSLKATHRQTKKTSFITTVNVILSELNVCQDIPEFWESDWVLSNRKVNKLAEDVEQFFSDRKFLIYLEKYLDLDRKLSEWENYE